jgi:hypothetical protein
MLWPLVPVQALLPHAPLRMAPVLVWVGNNICG